MGDGGRWPGLGSWLTDGRAATGPEQAGRGGMVMSGFKGEETDVIEERAGKVGNGGCGAWNEREGWMALSSREWLGGAQAWPTDRHAPTRTGWKRGHGIPYRRP